MTEPKRQGNYETSQWSNLPQIIPQHFARFSMTIRRYPLHPNSSNNILKSSRLNTP